MTKVYVIITFHTGQVEGVKVYGNVDKAENAWEWLHNRLVPDEQYSYEYLDVKHMEKGNIGHTMHTCIVED